MMKRAETISALTKYGYSAFKALEITIDAERGNLHALTILNLVKKPA